MARILYVLYFILIILMIVNIWKQPGDTVKKILWTVVLLVAPVLGVILFLLIEKSMFPKR